MPVRVNLPPPLTRGLFLVLVSLSSLNAAIRYHRRSWALPDVNLGDAGSGNFFTTPRFAVSYLVLIPTRSIFFPWTVLTAAFTENNIVSIIICGLVIWFGGRYLERAWGSKELAKFLLVVIVIPNVFAFCVYSLWFFFAGEPEYATPIQGLVAVEAGFLVALKQLVPEHTVALFKGAIRIRIKHFPAVFVLANMISGPLLGTDTAFWLSLSGFLTSWIHLRFFRISEITSSATGGEGATMKGDASETFSFVSFFPDALHPFFEPVSNTVYNGLVRLKIITPFSNAAIEAGNESAASRTETLPSIMSGNSGGGGGGRRAEAERRRALALQALDQRLNAASANRSTKPSVSAATLETSGEASAAKAANAPISEKEATVAETEAST